MARVYRKKPVVVEAVQWTGENHAEMCEFIDPEVFEIIPRVGLVIHTLEGDHHANPGDYIIKGVNGEFYPCKPDIFAKTYENSTLTQPNEPLTLEQLREMDGEPVWVNDEKTYAILQVWDDDNIDAIFSKPRGYIHAKDAIGMKIYRRPPEGEEEEKHVIEITENL